ncbi:MAG: nucleotidyltransferase family protein [Acidimicrobiia bacterium]|nr:nucleotidyltransferase family protein [Acidimicrobiia bacterium]
MADGYEVDLHRTFVAGPFGLSLRTEDLFDTETAIEIAGRTVVALGPEERFVHACFHAALGDREPRLVSLRDVAQILLGSPVDTSRTLDLAARWRVGAVLKRAIELTWSAFGLDSNPPLREWAREYVPSRFERQALRVYVGPSRSYAAQAVAGLRAVPDVAAKAAYARAMLVPDHGYLDERDGGYLRRLRRGVGLLVREVRQQ